MPSFEEEAFNRAQQMHRKPQFNNKEQSLILLLVILLMEENTDPSVLLALMYLLM